MTKKEAVVVHSFTGQTQEYQIPGLVLLKICFQRPRVPLCTSQPKLSFLLPVHCSLSASNPPLYNWFPGLPSVLGLCQVNFRLQVLWLLSLQAFQGISNSNSRFSIKMMTRFALEWIPCHCYPSTGGKRASSNPTTVGELERAVIF